MTWRLGDQETRTLDDPELVALRKPTAHLVFMEELGQALHVQSVVALHLLLAGICALWHSDGASH